MSELEIVLVAECGEEYDEIGNAIPVIKSKSVFSTVESVGGSEFFRANQEGIRPEYKVAVWDFEYSGETEVMMEGTKYSVYRTYKREDERVELYLKKKTGVRNEN